MYWRWIPPTGGGTETGGAVAQRNASETDPVVTDGAGGVPTRVCGGTQRTLAYVRPATAPMSRSRSVREFRSSAATGAPMRVPS